MSLFATRGLGSLPRKVAPRTIVTACGCHTRLADAGGSAGHRDDGAGCGNPEPVTPRDATPPAPSGARALFDGYEPLGGTYDELIGADGQPRAALAAVCRLLDGLGADAFAARHELAERAFRRGGITFSVYSDQRGEEKTLPFDLVPRVVAADDWAALEAGLVQRLAALEAFCADIYGDARIEREGVVPPELGTRSPGFCPQAKGIRPNGGRYVHVAGIDLIRDPDGAFRVLEDNLRVPSGVSYVLENRNILKRVLPVIFGASRVRAIDDYGVRLRDALRATAPAGVDTPTVVVLTPGRFNSAYFEHSFLARRMGVPLVEGRDLFVQGDRVYLKAIEGPQPVHVIYRRIDDEFLDPHAFRADSMLGVPGLFAAYAKGRVTLANAIGNGIADSKAIYDYVPAMIRFYLDEEPKLAQVQTFRCADPKQREHVRANLARMVVKRVDGSGGYGMLVGSRASAAEREEFDRILAAKGAEYIAQPVIELSTCPTWTGEGLAPRRVDLRPYLVSGRDTWVLPGGLTRVALVEGSYVVNSSQGGGSKDTWVLQGGSAP